MASFGQTLSSLATEKLTKTEKTWLSELNISLFTDFAKENLEYLRETLQHFAELGYYRYAFDTDGAFDEGGECENIEYIPDGVVVDGITIKQAAMYSSVLIFSW